MSQENVDAIRRYIDATNDFMHGEISSETYAESFDPLIEVAWPGERTYPDVPQHMHGGQTVVAFAEQYRERWAELTAEPVEVIEIGEDRIVALVRQSGRGRQSGIPIEIHFFAIYTLRDGKLRKVEYFRHREEALEAARLRE